MILVECDLDSIIECLAVFWVFIVHCDHQKHQHRDSGSSLDEMRMKERRLWDRKADDISVLDGLFSAEATPRRRHHSPAIRDLLPFNQTESKITT